MNYLKDLKENGQLANPYFCLMGINAESFNEGSAVLSMDVRPDMLNGAGWLQGGVYVSLIDEAMALCVYTLLNEGERIATVSETTNFYRGVREGRIIARARVVRRGRKIIFTEGFCFLEGDESNLLAGTTASFAVL